MCPWTFCPTMDLARNPCWSRFWESFGEDPYLQSVMAATETRALQGDDPNHIGKEHIAVSLKHYMAYSAAISGRDRTPAYVSPSDLREKHFAPFKACIEAGALTLMVNSSSINGVPMHANHELLTVWLKEDLNWDGMIVTDRTSIISGLASVLLQTAKKFCIRHKCRYRYGNGAVRPHCLRRYTAGGKRRPYPAKRIRCLPQGAAPEIPPRPVR